MPRIDEENEGPVLANADVNKSTVAVIERRAPNESPISPVWLILKKEEFERMINDSMQSPKSGSKSANPKTKRRKSKAQPMPPSTTVTEAVETSITPASEQKDTLQSPIPSVWLAQKKEVFEKMINYSNQSTVPSAKSMNRNAKRRNSKPQVTSPTARIPEEMAVLQSSESAVLPVSLVPNKGVSSPIIDDLQSAKTAKSVRETEESLKVKSESAVSSSLSPKAEVLVPQGIPELPFISPKIVWKLNNEAEAKAKKGVKSNFLEDIRIEVMKWQSEQEKANLVSEGSFKNAKNRRGTKSATAESSKKRPSNSEAQLSRLPNEILDEIFGYAVLQDKPIHVDALFRDLPKKQYNTRERQAERCRWPFGAMYTCKRFYALGRPLYSSLNTFTVSLAAFRTLNKTMKLWPKIPTHACNINPAIANIQRLIIVDQGPGEWAPSSHLVWHALPQFLKGFKQLKQVELDFRFCGWSEIDWHTPKEQYYYDALPPSADLKRKMEITGVRFGWTLKEDREGRREGIKDGALMVRLLPAKLLAETYPDMKNSVEGEVIDGLERYLNDVQRWA